MPSQYAIATRLVQEYHAGQMYGDKPYIYHLLGVALAVRQAGGDEIDQTVALLHDIIEDTPCDASMLLAAGLTYEVVDAVIALTKFNFESHREYLTRCSNNVRGRKVKVWDSHFNLTHSLREGNENRIKRYTKNIVFLTCRNHD